MDLVADDQEAALVAAARDLLDGRAPLTRVRDAHESATGILDDVWDAATDQGWFALCVPESGGGLGLSGVEATLLATQIGRSLAPGPWAATIAAAATLHGTPAGDRAATGTKIALGLDTRGGDPTGVRDGALVGHVPRVEFPLEDSLLLVDVDGEVWWAEQFAASMQPSIDPGLRVGSVDLDGLEAHPTGRPTGELAKLYDLLIAAMLAGVARASAEMALEYAKVREQFGRPIGAFQAVKHRIADMFLRAERTDCLVALAAVADRDLGGAEREIASARLAAADAAIANSGESILVHGAIGFTWECDAHLYLERARTLASSRVGDRELVSAILSSPGVPSLV
jgi:alkylation response protein AidB-like acyl-CoA dehydrogenase